MRVALPLAPDIGERWKAHGLCVDDPRPDDWFPAGEENQHPQVARAVATCGRCPVRPECLEYAMEAGERGIWGGLDGEQRTRLQRQRNRKALK